MISTVVPARFKDSIESGFFFAKPWNPFQMAKEKIARDRLTLKAFLVLAAEEQIPEREKYQVYQMMLSRCKEEILLSLCDLGHDRKLNSLLNTSEDL